MVRKFLLTAAVAVAALVTPSVSRADFVLSGSLNGDSFNFDFTTQTGSIGGTSGSFTFLSSSFTGLTFTNYPAGGAGQINEWDVNGLSLNGLRLSVSASLSNSPGNVQTGQLDLDSLTLRDTGASNATASLSLTDTGFTAPAAPRVIQTTYNASLQGDSGSAQATDSASYADGIYTVNMPSKSATSNSPLSSLTNTSATFTSAAPYSLTDAVSIIGLFSGDTVSASVDTNVYQVAPAPSSLILADRKSVV